MIKIFANMKVAVVGHTFNDLEYKIIELILQCRWLHLQLSATKETTFPKMKIETSPHRKYQSVIYWEKSSSTELDSIVGNLQRKHLDFVNHVLVFGFDLVNQHTDFISLQTTVTTLFFPKQTYFFNGGIADVADIETINSITDARKTSIDKYHRIYISRLHCYRYIEE
jgi:hypothetical protein